MKLPQVLRHPNFKKLYYAGLISELGSFITETALMLTVFELSGQNKSYLGFSRAAFLLFLTIGNLFGGALGDKYNRRDILIFTNYARIPLVISLMFFSNVYLIIAVNSLIALFTGLYNPTRQTLVNDLVPKKDIPSANALFGSTFAIIHMLGPFLGATLYSYFKGITEILSFDLTTYFIGIYLISTVAYSSPKQKKAKKTSIFADTMEGAKYIFRRKDLFAIITNAMGAGLCIGFLIPLMLPYFIEVLHLDERAYGIAFSFFGLGGVLGGALSAKLCNKYSNGKVITWSLCIEPLMMVTWLQLPGFYNTCIVFLFWGIAVFTRITAQLNYISDKVETKYLTRAFSLLDLAFVFPNIASGIIVSIIGDRLTTYEILNTVSLLFVAIVFLRLPSKNMRALYRSTNNGIVEDTDILNLLDQKD